MAGTSTRKAAWIVRAEQIRNRFPEVTDLDWKAALTKDDGLFARVLRDMLKLEQAIPGRSGPRPSLDQVDASDRLDRLFGRDFTQDPFPEALKKLTKNASIRAIADRTGLNRNVVYRLMTGEMEPDGFHLTQIAEAWNKHPSYFLEWRLLYITKAITSRLEWNPEASVAIYLELDDQRRRAVAEKGA
jgi:transcriptional regulator with XRE-family HTH domain